MKNGNKFLFDDQDAFIKWTTIVIKPKEGVITEKELLELQQSILERTGKKIELNLVKAYLRCGFTLEAESSMSWYGPIDKESPFHIDNVSKQIKQGKNPIE